jgi:hypothetical protein
MMRSLFVLALGLWASAAADAGVSKCVDAKGNVTYTDRPCATGDKQEGVELQSGTSSASAGESTASSGAGGENARDQHFRRELDRATEQMEAKKRDLDARCSNGEKKACAQATCIRIITDGASTETIRDCSRAQGFKFTADWAQMSEVHVSNGSSTSVDVTCLKNPEILRFGARETKMFSSLRLKAENRASGFHDRDRFYTNMLGGPDFATWEEAATILCDPVASAKAHKAVKEKL